MRRRQLLAGLGTAAGWTLLGRGRPLLAAPTDPARASAPDADPDLTPDAGLASTPDADPDLEAFRALCLGTARASVVDGNVIPSSAYAHASWLRDAYWTMAALGDPDLQQRTWRRFAAAQDPATGQVPTSLLHANTVNYAADDESTALFVLLALDLQRAGRPLQRLALERAGRYLLGHLDAAGRYRVGPGDFTWWLDTLYLAERDTVAYSQGVVAVALRALVELGVALPPGAVERAEAAYRALYRPGLGAITLSAATTLLDVSCLVGEHLAARLFGRALLPDEVVTSTLGRFRRVSFPDGAFLGFPVATQLDGAYLPEAWFSPAPDNWPGYYHNGGSWLLYDALALDVARRHGAPAAAELLRARIAAETRQASTLHEYLATDPSRGQLGGVPFPWRTGYAWNSYVGTVVSGQ